MKRSKRKITWYKIQKWQMRKLKKLFMNSLMIECLKNGAKYCRRNNFLNDHPYGSLQTESSPYLYAERIQAIYGIHALKLPIIDVKVLI